jgi:hypothetical protein
MAALVVKQPPDHRRHLRVRHTHGVLPAAVKRLWVDTMAQEPVLPRHLRSHLSCCFPREDAFARAVARARLRELILVVAVGRRVDKHCCAVLQAQVGASSLNLNVCA